MEISATVIYLSAKHYLKKYTPWLFERWIKLLPLQRINHYPADSEVCFVLFFYLQYYLQRKGREKRKGKGEKEREETTYYIYTLGTLRYYI